MARSGLNTVAVIFGLVLLAIGTAAAIFGPRLYREGRAMVAPIAAMARAEDQLQSLNEDFPYQPPADGLVPEDRLEAFLAIRRDLKPRYESWGELVRRVERDGDSWQAAKEVLEATSEILTAQIATLRSHEMSQKEFQALEFAVYDDWLRHLPGGVDASADGELLDLTRADLRFVRELADRHGSSPALARIEERLQTRQDALTSPGVPRPPDVPEANARLFWTHREVISELDLQNNELHSVLRRGDFDGVTVDVKEGGDGGGIDITVG